MYGMVNKAIEELICLHYDEATWERIKVRAGVDVDVFMSNDSYGDDITYALVGAVSAELGVGAEQVLETFGRHWILHTATENYGGLMQAGGSSLHDFLRNLPNFHTRVALYFPELRPPRFSHSHAHASGMRLHYRSEREGLAHFVIGLCNGLGEMFDTPVRITHIARRSEGADHDEFDLEWDGLADPHAHATGVTPAA